MVGDIALGLCGFCAKSYILILALLLIKFEVNHKL